MTKAAQVTKELRSKERVAAETREHEAREGKFNRQTQRAIANQQADTTIKAAKINALGRMGSAAMKGSGGFSSGGGMKSPNLNDPNWYKAYLPDADIFTRVPTYDRLGSSKFGKRYGYDDINDYTFNVPGVITLHWIPTVGPQARNTAYFRNAVNQSLARTKEKVLALNSRSNVSWEAADLGYNFFCSADIATLILELRRVILTYQTYYPKNQYFAKTLISAMGWNFADVQLNFAEYRKQYAILARKFNSAIVAPADLTLYQRRLFLASNVFIDSEDAKNPRQMYVYVQQAAFRLGDTEEFCSCGSIEAGGYRNNLATYVAMLHLMMARITDSPSFIEMYQDLRHAFGTKLLTLPVSVEDEVLALNNNALNVEQIHNTVTAYVLDEDTIPSLGNMLGFYLCQDADGYLYQGKSSGNASDRKFEYLSGGELLEISPDIKEQLFGDDAKLMFNMHKSDVSGDDILDITRNAFTGKVTVNSDGTSSQTIESCGTEVIYKCVIHAIGLNAGSPDDDLTTWYGRYNFFSNFKAKYFLNKASLRSAFDWAPLCHWYTYTPESLQTDEESHGTLMDAYTTFDIDTASLERIHEICVMSELYLPDTGYTR